MDSTPSVTPKIELQLVPDEQLTGIECDFVKPEEIESLWPTINAMATLMSDQKGVGLAAAQVGIQKRFFVCRFPDQPKNAFVYFNPSYKPMKSHGTVRSREACLSYPGKFYVVERYRRVKATYFEWDEDRKQFHKREENMDGFKSVLFQHETDHQNGMTIRVLGEEWVEPPKKDSIDVPAVEVEKLPTEEATATLESVTEA